MELPQGELLRQVLARGRGMVFVTGHLGNFELLGRRVARAGVANAVIAKATWDEKLDQRIVRFRADGGVTTFWREAPDTGRAIIRTFRTGKALGLLIDQDTDVQGVFVPFFGKLAFTLERRLTSPSDSVRRWWSPPSTGRGKSRGTAIGWSSLRFPSRATLPIGRPRWCG